MASFGNDLFREFRRISPQGLPRHQAVTHCLTAHNSDMAIISTTDCKLTAYHIVNDSFDVLDEIDKFKGWVVKCELSLDNTFLVVLVEKMVAIYNARKRFVPITRFKPHNFVINDIAWSKCMRTPAEQQLLATCGKDGTIRLWRGKDILSAELHDLTIAEEPYRSLGVFQDPTSMFRSAALEDPGHVESVVCVSFNPSDEFILSGGVDYQIILWEIVSGGHFVRAFQGHLGVVMNVCWTYSGERFASVGADKKVLVWSPVQSSPLMWLDAHSDVVENCTFINDNYLVTSGRDRHFYVWDTNATEAVTDPFASILDKRVKRYVYRGSSRTRGWVNTLCIDSKGERILLVTSQLLNSFVVLQADFNDYDWHTLKWYQKIFRRSKKEVLHTYVGRRVSAMFTRRVGIRRADSRNYGRQISWSWSGAMVEQSRAGTHPKGGGGEGHGLGRAFSRGISGEIGRSISRGFSRQISADSVFDPSTYTLDPITEEDKHMSRMKNTATRGVPAVQQMGERPGTRVAQWMGKIYTSRDNIEYTPPPPAPQIKKGNSFHEWFFRKEPKVAPKR